MLFRAKDLEAIMSGRVTTAFRRWKRPSARAGSQLRTPLGMVAIDAVEEIDPATLTEADAKAANYDSLAALQAMLGSRSGTCYRVVLRPGGPDPRHALREAADLSAGESRALDQELGKLDRETPWTLATLRLIAERPGVVSTELAHRLGQERFAFKANVRKLKALGLTISLDVGYRLSPRGEAYLTGAAERSMV